ncbi:DUF6475 domain-containing protein, partial [Herbaspirillum sp. YR522]|uniref:DUF6475 domain-containing protein n=1 Tax=Herbaspirillum sp. YR522 TaxID=1144342 RepID=UPI00026FA2A3
MIQTDRKEFFQYLAGVYAMHTKDLSEGVGSVWWQALAPFDLAAVKDALGRHCINPDVGQYLPKPADVVRMLHGSTQDAALMAWAKVDRAVREVGTYRSVAFDDGLIHRVVLEMGGWVVLGTKGDDEWPFVRNEFVNRYRGYRARTQLPDYPPVLIGMSEASNSKQGFASEGPFLIGEPGVARAVIGGGSR